MPNMTDKAALTQRLLEAIGRDMEFFYAHLHDDIILQFPFAESNGFPTEVAGIIKVRPHFESVVAMLSDWRAFDIRVTQMADPDRFLVEYRGASTGRHGPYEQQYCTIVGYRDGKLVLFREHWDTLLFARAFGSASET